MLFAHILEVHTACFSSLCMHAQTRRPLLVFGRSRCGLMRALIACLQAAIIEAEALPALTALLERAQPDGQYAAAAALYNLTGQEPEVRQALVSLGALPHLIHMLHAESWYASSCTAQGSCAPCYTCSRMCGCGWWVVLGVCAHVHVCRQHKHHQLLQVLLHRTFWLLVCAGSLYKCMQHNTFT